MITPSCISLVRTSDHGRSKCAFQQGIHFRFLDVGDVFAKEWRIGKIACEGLFAILVNVAAQNRADACHAEAFGQAATTRKQVYRGQGIIQIFKTRPDFLENLLHAWQTVCFRQRRIAALISLRTYDIVFFHPSYFFAAKIIISPKQTAFWLSWQVSFPKQPLHRSNLAAQSLRLKDAGLRDAGRRTNPTARVSQSRVSCLYMYTEYFPSTYPSSLSIFSKAVSGNEL